MDMIANFALPVLGVLVAVIVATFSRVLADDVKAWLPRLTAMVIDRAVASLPDSAKERYREEWLAHVNDTPGDFSKFVMAIGLLSASNTIHSQVKENQGSAILEVSQRLLGVLFILNLVPFFALIATAIRVTSSGPVYQRIRITVEGRHILVLVFLLPEIGPPTIADSFSSRFKRSFYRLLNETHLNKLPVLWCVVRGEIKLPQVRHWPNVFRAIISNDRDISKKYEFRLGRNPMFVDVEHDDGSNTGSKT